MAIDMPRGHRIDKPVTRMMLREGYFTDARSFVSLPDGDDCDSHVFLYGEDWTTQKARAWNRSKGICGICNKTIWSCADPDHIVKRSKGGSDDIGNLRTVHRECHEKRHPEKRLQWTATT